MSWKWIRLLLCIAGGLFVGWTVSWGLGGFIIGAACLLSTISSGQQHPRDFSRNQSTDFEPTEWED